MTDFVRIRTENGMEATVSKVHAESVGADVLKDQDPLDRLGRPRVATRAGGRRAKPRTTVKAAAAKKAAARKTAAKKATARKAASSPANTTSGGVAAEPAKEATK